MLTIIRTKKLRALKKELIEMKEQDTSHMFHKEIQNEGTLLSRGRYLKSLVVLNNKWLKDVLEGKPRDTKGGGNYGRKRTK